MYKPDHKFYCYLLLLFVCIATLVYLFPSNDRLDGVLTGIVGGAVSSVLVAWLIDIMNCKRRSENNAILMKKYFIDFDMFVGNVFSEILYDYYRGNKGIDPERKYSISEILDIVKKSDGSLTEWSEYYQDLGRAFESIEPSVIVADDPTENHAEMYEAVIWGRKNYMTYNAMRQYMDNMSTGKGDTFEYIMFPTYLNLIERVYKSRGIDKKFDIGYLKLSMIKKNNAKSTASNQAE